MHQGVLAHWVFQQRISSVIRLWQPAPNSAFLWYNRRSPALTHDHFLISQQRHCTRYPKLPGLPLLWHNTLTAVRPITSFDTRSWLRCQCHESTLWRWIFQQTRSYARAACHLSPSPLFEFPQCQVCPSSSCLQIWLIECQVILCASSRCAILTRELCDPRVLVHAR